MRERFLAYCVLEADQKSPHHFSELMHELRMHSRSIHDLMSLLCHLHFSQCSILSSGKTRGCFMWITTNQPQRTETMGKRQRIWDNQNALSTLRKQEKNILNTAEKTWACQSNQKKVINSRNQGTIPTSTPAAKIFFIFCLRLDNWQLISWKFLKIPGDKNPLKIRSRGF